MTTNIALWDWGGRGVGRDWGFCEMNCPESVTRPARPKNVFCYSIGLVRAPSFSSCRIARDVIRALLYWRVLSGFGWSIASEASSGEKSLLQALTIIIFSPTVTTMRVSFFCISGVLSLLISVPLAAAFSPLLPRARHLSVPSKSTARAVSTESEKLLFGTFVAWMTMLILCVL